MNKLNITEHVSLKKYTTFRCGGEARFFAEPSSFVEVSDLLAFASSESMPVFVMGMGSNILVSDSGFDGLVIRLGRNMGEISLMDTGDSSFEIDCGAGAPLALLGNLAVKEGLEGCEFCCGIPGSVGGGVFMNAGAYGREIKDIAVSVTYLEAGEVKTVPASSCEFGYRKSIFTKGDSVILGLKVRLDKGDASAIRAYAEELRVKRANSQPIDVPSAGSTFKRPEGYFAGKLIQDCGLKGFALDDSGAQVSPKHSGFIVNNDGRASAKDVYRLIMYVSDTVFGKTGVRLEPEVRLIGDFS